MKEYVGYISFLLVLVIGYFLMKAESKIQLLENSQVKQWQYDSLKLEDQYKAGLLDTVMKRYFLVSKTDFKTQEIIKK